MEILKMVKKMDMEFKNLILTNHNNINIVDNINKIKKMDLE